jgi:hypothetical protein
MTQKSPTKHFLPHPIENHQNRCQLIKNSVTNFTYTQNYVGSNAEQIQLNHDIETNTAKQITRTFDNEDARKDIAQVLVQGK